MKLRAPKGEGALALDDLDGSTGGLVALVGRAALDDATLRCRRAARSPGRHLRPRPHVRRAAAASPARRGGRQPRRSSTWRRRSGCRSLATGGVRFATPADRPLFDVLTCMHHHTDLAQRRPPAGAERRAVSQVARRTWPRSSPICRTRWRATRELADRLQYTMADLGYRFPEYPVPPGETQASFLRQITDVGARDRYRPYHDRARAQIARELDLIEKLELAGYFLIVWDIVELLPPARHPRAGARVGRQQRRLLQPRASRPSIRSGWSCCSSGSSRKSAASGPISISICRAAIGASTSSSTSTRSTGASARR